jgi:carbon monoxide dehydrogenase subunit G
MFSIKAQFTDKVEIAAGQSRVRGFFVDMRNFVELMPGIESIHTDNAGRVQWKIRAEIPVIGSLTERFAVLKTEDSDDVVEWSPVPGEQRNLLRFGADFVALSDAETAVRFSQAVELRRDSARDLHPLASLAGESAISREMSRRISEMIKIFIIKAKERLER